MKKKFIKSWVRSVQPRKQRKYRYNAPLHIKKRFLSAHLSPTLREKYHKRSLVIRKGDKVKILRGDYKNTEATVERVSVVRSKVYLSGLTYTKKDGTRVSFPFEASNLMIVELGEVKGRI